MRDGGHVLLVDDDEDIRESIADVLRHYGFRVETAADGRDALERLRAGGPAPAVILLDLMMPVMDGWQFRAAQLADAALAPIPVVALSGQGRLEEHLPGLRIAEAIRKPFDVNQLVELMSRYTRPGCSGVRGS